MSRRMAALWIALGILLCSVIPADSADLAGKASYYDDGPGLYAAVHSWHFGDTPYVVRVATKTAHVDVTVRDFCQCYVGTSNARVIDLSPEAFSRLAPLSAGLVRVTVTFLGHAPKPEPKRSKPTPPPTDAEVLS